MSQCRKPKKVYYHKFEKTAKGRKQIYWKNPIHPDGTNRHLFDEGEIRCGKCLPCALYKSSQIGLRAYHEAITYGIRNNMFLTLTVSDEHIEEVFPNHEVRKEYIQKFNRRYRKRFKGITTIKHPITEEDYNGIKFLYCGEYGDKNGRPHYHSLVFNHRLEDLVPYKQVGKVTYYTSKTIQELWPYGQVMIGELTLDSANYVARYTAKKYLQENDPKYEDMEKPFLVFPGAGKGFGLGRAYYEKNRERIYYYDVELVPKSAKITGSNGKPYRVKPPKYYDRLEQDRISEEDWTEKINKRIEYGKESEWREFRGNPLFKGLRRHKKAKILKANINHNLQRTL